MLGLELGWSEEWLLRADGDVIRRRFISHSQRSDSRGELSAAYEDEVIPWGQVPYDIRNQFRAMRLERLGHAASGEDG